MKPVMRWWPSQLVTAHPGSTGNGTSGHWYTGEGRGCRSFLREVSVHLHSARAWGWLTGSAWVHVPALPLTGFVITGKLLLRVSVSTPVKWDHCKLTPEACEDDLS